MDENKRHRILRNYQDGNHKSIRELKSSLEATVSHFNKALEWMEKSQDELAPEIFEHTLEKNAKPWSWIMPEAYQSFAGIYFRLFTSVSIKRGR